MNFEQRLQETLERRISEGAFRELRLHPGLFDFCSNDYLGMAAMEFKIPKKNGGSTGSRLLTGNTAEALALEEYLAGFFKSEAALLFNSGYVANTGLLSCIAKKNDLIVYDELCHASLRDGIRLSNARNFSFAHNEVFDLKQKIQRAGCEGQIFIVTESVFSMDGDIAPLKEIFEVAEQLNARVIVDEAHAVGVWGEQGRGLAQDFANRKELLARIVTFGKAIGSHGAAIIGSELLKNYLINFSRPFIYTTALPPVILEEIKIRFQKMETMDEERSRLFKNVEFFKEQLVASKLRHLKSNTAIQCVIIPGNHEVKRWSRYMHEKGYDVRPILSPTIPEGSERLRFCIHSFNCFEQIQNLFVELANME
ncbi:MAG: 8-amino-7-oxononanoate synthase [Flavobacteriales bacterium]|nr:8-amino-7-oxononanoate synthase [Flavobacteriales bacterium]